MEGETIYVEHGDGKIMAVFRCMNPVLETIKTEGKHTVQSTLFTNKKTNCEVKLLSLLSLPTYRINT